MITLQEFDTYKIYSKQAICPFCSRSDVPDGDGLYVCDLDEKYNPQLEHLMNEKNGAFFVTKYKKSLHQEMQDSPTSYFACYCDSCDRYWIETYEEMVGHAPYIY